MIMTQKSIINKKKFVYDMERENTGYRYLVAKACDYQITKYFLNYIKINRRVVKNGQGKA